MLTFFFLLQISLVLANQPKVDTELGSIIGFNVETPGGLADIFLGIPFAQAPVGTLRFEKPEPVKPWSTPLNATKWGYECVPHTLAAKVFEVNEDCLTLNVFRPSKQPPPGGFPVLFWVHGGGFEIGSARLYGYQTFADAYVPRDVIVVTVQYRIGVLGFLSTGTDELPGNLGLWDLAESLRFTHKHISAFGGNPNKITLWGLSAGGAAVGQLMLSRETRDLAASSIEMSGSPWCSWATGRHVVNSSLILAQELDCTTDVKSCMKTKTVEEIDAAVRQVGITTDNLRIIRWGPRLDGSFFAADLDTLVKEAEPKPSIVGVSDKDAGFFTVMGRSQFIHRLAVGGNLHKFGKKEMTEKTEKLLALSAEYGSQHDVATKKAIGFYLNEYDDQDEAFFLNKYTEFIGDTLFNVPAVEGAQSRQKAGWPVYLYSFDHFNDGIWKNIDAPEGVRGSVHINEFTYMFDKSFMDPIEYTDADIKIKENLRDTIANFAKTGVASWKGVDWKPISDSMDYISIKDKAEIKTNFYKESTDFWRSQKAYGYDVIDMMSTESRSKDEL